MNKELIDRAWACLPKEFKEEVKRIYRIADSDVDQMIAMITLENVFGHQNLTSDAVEEEMLTVKRSDVINEFDKLHKLSYKDLQLGLNAFRTLFGSKCLPDELNEDNFATKKPQPAEPKFNLGDKAILKGYVCTITSIVYEQGKFVGYKIESPLLHGIATVPESDLEPYTEPKNEVVKMKPIKSHVKVYLATKEEDEEFRTLLYKNGFMWISGTALISLSNWDSANEASHIHFVYHNKTVAYLGKRTKETLTFTEFKKRYFGEDVNLSQETVNCDKQFDNILKDGFHDHNRLHIASIIMSGLLASGKEKHPVRRAMDLADALIAECDKEGGEE